MPLTSPGQTHLNSGMLHNSLLFNHHSEARESSNSMQQLTNMSSTSNPTVSTPTSAHLSTHNTGMDVNNNTNTHHTMSNHRINKELQFLQSAINEADLSDLYQTLTNTSASSSNELNTSASSSNNSINANNNIHSSSHHASKVAAASSGSGGYASSFQQHQHGEPSDMNMIVQMQGELIDQHKELRTIEHQTMEQLRVLQSNLNRLAKRFDSFECTVLNHVSRASSRSQQQHQHQADAHRESSRNNLSKLNNSMQQIKVR
jgi:hypothetical protein